jgi:membrane protease YdiL (CAAX protease family)
MLRVARAALVRRSLAAYFALAYAISWGAVAAVHAGPGGGAAAMFAAQASGPVVASLLLTFVINGRAGLSRLFAQMLVWRAPVGCYAIALLAAPLAAALVLFLLSLASPTFMPAVATAADPWQLVWLGIAGGVLAGGLEELGWTGFATARMPRRWGILFAGLLIGCLHGAWHFLPGFIGEGAQYGVLYWPYFLVFWIGGLAALRVIIIWLYRRTGSLLMAQLAHATFTGSLLVLWPQASAAETLLWTTMFAVLLWLVALTLVRADGRIRVAEDVICRDRAA